MRSIQRVYILLIVLVILLGLAVNFCLRIQVPTHIQNLVNERKNSVNTIDCHFVNTNATKNCIQFDHEFYLPLESFKHQFDVSIVKPFMIYCAKFDLFISLKKIKFLKIERLLKINKNVLVFGKILQKTSFSNWYLIKYC